MIIALAVAIPQLASLGPSAGAVTLPTSGFYLAVDCDPAVAGIQSQCTLPSSPPTTALSANIVLVNAGGADRRVAVFSFNLYNPTCQQGLEWRSRLRRQDVDRGRSRRRRADPDTGR